VHAHSITSSARESSEGGTVRPSACLFQVDQQFELGRLFDREIRGLDAAQYAIDITGTAPRQIDIAGAVGDQPTGIDKDDCPDRRYQPEHRCCEQRDRAGQA